ncbi:hypothetical protein NSTC745_03041 [Nostoc sp. DSM 114161]|jgi:hypothetical protein
MRQRLDGIEAFSEIRDLKIENQRILKNLFGRQEKGE